jgi:hypothetical protein
VGSTYPWSVSFIRDIAGNYQFSYSNAWGYDNLGFWGATQSAILGEYVNNMRASNGGNGAACTVSAPQSMYMYCSGNTGPGQYYSLYGALTDQIYGSSSGSSLTTIRDGLGPQRSYP